ncbi:MAG: SdpI family protein [Candidatus Altiarchaeota archaeon]|nr:SdpI family protein [Candidatus Altiarchaeota archaeon]
MYRHIALSLGLVFIMFALGFFLYGSMPDRMASHWNASGEVDGFMDRGVALLFMPALVLIILGIFVVVPMIDPLKKNIEEFRGYYNNFVLLIVAFMFYIYCVTILLNLGYKLSINALIAPALAVLIFYSGVVMGKSRRNWFVGIRTPWTLSSDVVWERTHALACKLFKACGVVLLFSVFFPNLMVYLVLVPILASALGLVVYSYLEYLKVGKA